MNNSKNPATLEHLLTANDGKNGNLRDKRKKSIIITGQHVTVNAVLAATPIPFSDAPFLMLSEGILVARILRAYEMGASLGALSGIFASVGGTLLSSLGVMTAAGIIKCIPGAGTVAGGLINAAVAGTLTVAVGAATIGICEHSWLLASMGCESDLERFLHDLDKELDEALRDAYNRATKMGPGHSMEWA